MINSQHHTIYLFKDMSKSTKQFCINIGARIGVSLEISLWPTYPISMTKNLTSFPALIPSEGQFDRPPDYPLSLL